MTLWFLDALFFDDEQIAAAEAQREKRRLEKLKRQRIAKKKADLELDKIRDSAGLAPKTDSKETSSYGQPGAGPASKSQSLVGSALDRGFGFGAGPSGGSAAAKAPLPPGANCPGLPDSGQGTNADLTPRSKINRPF